MVEPVETFLTWQIIWSSGCPTNIWSCSLHLHSCCQWFHFIVNSAAVWPINIWRACNIITDWWHTWASNLCKIFTAGMNIYSILCLSAPVETQAWRTECMNCMHYIQLHKYRLTVPDTKASYVDIHQCFQMPVNKRNLENESPVKITMIKRLLTGQALGLHNMLLRKTIPQHLVTVIWSQLFKHLHLYTGHNSTNHTLDSQYVSFNIRMCLDAQKGCSNSKIHSECFNDLVSESLLRSYVVCARLLIWMLCQKFPSIFDATLKDQGIDLKWHSSE